MFTTSFFIKDYLAEWLQSKYGIEGVVTLPSHSDLNILLWDVMSTRPRLVSPIDTGNLTVSLPSRRAGKRPETYNYVSTRGAKLFELRALEIFRLDLFQHLDTDRTNGSRKRIIDSVGDFMSSNGIHSITEDALVKSYYRYRMNNRPHQVRGYKRKNDRNEDIPSLF